MQSLLSNFALILFVLMVVTGIIWFADVFVWAKQRRRAADAALLEFEAETARLIGMGVKPDAGKTREGIEHEYLRQPVWIEYSGSFFPVIMAVFVVRSFLFEPFKIPTTSMVPTLEVGDLILVNKFTYGIRLPIINKKVLDISDPKRGDVMVFKYPKDTSLDYIKRVVGVPGDKIEYKNKRLIINGQEQTYQQLQDYHVQDGLASSDYHHHFTEKLGNVSHNILNNQRAAAYVSGAEEFPQRELCSYNTEGFICTVPPGHYFMMGDNRDNSQDSRIWGFVPNQNIVGRAFFVWMNLGNLKRIGGFQ